jgi:uncharacterized OsmC-like protein
MEMLVSALGACSLVDVLLILAKKRQTRTSLEMDVFGEKAAAIPAVRANHRNGLPPGGRAGRASRARLH